MARGFSLHITHTDGSPVVSAGTKRFAGMPIRIGRNSLNDFQVSHQFVSDFHARIEEVEGRIWVRDLNSKNGVYVLVAGARNPTRIRAQEPVDLAAHGFEFYLGPVIRMRLEVIEVEPALMPRDRFSGTVLGNRNMMAQPPGAPGPYPPNPAMAGGVGGPPRGGGFGPPPGSPAGVPGGPAGNAGLPPMRPMAPTPAVPPGAVAPGAVPPGMVRGMGAPPGGPPPMLAGAGGLPPLPPQMAGGGAGGAATPPPVVTGGFPAANVRGPAGGQGWGPPGAGRPPGYPQQERGPGAGYSPYGPNDPSLGAGGGTPPGGSNVPGLSPLGRAGAGDVPVLPPIGELPPLDGAPGMPVGGGLPAGGAGGSYPPPPGGGYSEAVGKRTQHFGMSREMLAFMGLQELGGSLVPGQPLETTGDVARLITKLHDTVEVFCRSFIPLREGYAQFVSSMDLQRAAMQRTCNRSRGYVDVERARSGGEVASALLNWRDESLDAPEAIEGIFADLMIHQVALLDGVMQGVRSLLDDLSPENLEKMFDSQDRGALSILSGRHKALWQLYCEHYEHLADEKQAFSHIFGQEFTDAYREYRRRRSESGG